MQTVIHVESITPIQTCTIQGSFRTQNSQVERTKHGTCRTQIIQVKCTLSLSKIKNPSQNCKTWNMPNTHYPIIMYVICGAFQNRIPRSNRMKHEQYQGSRSEGKQI